VQRWSTQFAALLFLSWISLSALIYIYIYLFICIEDRHHCSILISVSDYKESIPIPTLREKLPLCGKRNMNEQLHLFVLDPKTLKQARNLNNLARLEFLKPVSIINLEYGSSRIFLKRQYTFIFYHTR
jgi:hypothetical protein